MVIKKLDFISFYLLRYVYQKLLLDEDKMKVFKYVVFVYFSFVCAYGNCAYS